MQKRRYALLGFTALAGLGITTLSYTRLNASRLPVSDKASALMLQAQKDEALGDRNGAIALTNEAVSILRPGMADVETRARLLSGAMDLCSYGDQQSALTLIGSIRLYDDSVGRSAQTIFDEIKKGDPHWQAAPVPTAKVILLRKTILKHRPGAGF